MSLTGIHYLALPPNATSSTSKLTTALSHQFPEQEHQPYHLTHNLFVDTSSQLPNADVSKRAYTQILHFSHDSQNTYVGSLDPAVSDRPSLITIPATSAGELTALIGAKLQPLWFPRQTVAVEHGISMTTPDGAWRVSIGDVRLVVKGQAGPGALRGTILEICSTDDQYELRTLDSPDVRAEAQAVFSKVLNKMFKEAGEEFDASKITLAATAPVQSSEDLDAHSVTKVDWELAKLYMEVLRGSR